LFPLVNPIGSAFIINPYFQNVTRQERIGAVKKITFYAFAICVFTLLLGHWVLELFDLSIPIIQVAGGIMICKIGWESLTSDNVTAPDKTFTEKSDPEIEHHSTIANKLFYPITFPLLNFLTNAWQKH
jgi:multiple antibiotic resistance protein